MRFMWHRNVHLQGAAERTPRFGCAIVSGGGGGERGQRWEARRSTAV
jgi:hypothetical protein